MSMPKTTLSPLNRSFAAIVLIAFAAAQTLCFIHCHLGNPTSASVLSSCHAAAAQNACPGKCPDSTSNEPTGTASCLILQHITSVASHSDFAFPDWPALYDIPSGLLSSCSQDLDLQAIAFRQASFHDWVFTPEVSLGPACRSLAPPASA